MYFTSKENSQPGGGGGMQSGAAAEVSEADCTCINMFLFLNKSYAGITAIERRFEVLTSEAHSNMKALIMAVVSK